MKQAIFLTTILIVAANLQLSGQEGKPLVISGVDKLGEVAMEDLYNRAYLWASDEKYKYVFSHFVHQGSGEQPINYGRINNSKFTDLQLSAETHLVVINDLLSSVRKQVMMNAQSLQEVMKKPTELEAVW